MGGRARAAETRAGAQGAAAAEAAHEMLQATMQEVLRRVLELQRVYERVGVAALRDYQRAPADLERAVGQSISRLGGASDQELNAER